LCSHVIIYMGLTRRFALIGWEKIQKSENGGLERTHLRVKFRYERRRASFGSPVQYPAEPLVRSCRAEAHHSFGTREARPEFAHPQCRANSTGIAYGSDPAMMRGQAGTLAGRGGRTFGQVRGFPLKYAEK
jgi:hypothetical protein